MPELMERGSWTARRWCADTARSGTTGWPPTSTGGWRPTSFTSRAAKPCVAESSRHADVFVVTTKQARFASAIMSRKANLEIPPERLFSQTVSGVPKTEVLLALQADRRARRAPRLRGGQDEHARESVRARRVGNGELFLVDWGYNTEEERARARQPAHTRRGSRNIRRDARGSRERRGVEKRRECTASRGSTTLRLLPRRSSVSLDTGPHLNHVTEPAVETLSEKARHATRQRWSARHDGGRDGTGGRVSGGREDRRASPRRSGRARLWETRAPRLGGTPPGVIGRRVGVGGCVVRSHRAPPGRGGAYASDSGGAPPVPGRASRGYVAGASGASRRG